MLHLITTLDESRIEWLPQFLAHYRELGVERIHLSLHFEPRVTALVKRQRTEQAVALAAAFGVDLAAVLVCVYDSYVLRTHHNQLQSQIPQASDWIVWADIDEFQIYPDRLPSLIDAAERSGIDYFGGLFVDRTTEDGSLPAFDPGRPIWSQFPRQSQITRDLTTACTEKVVCARSRVRLTPGNHAVCDQSLAGRQALVEVHHFKWDASVVPRLRRRLTPQWQERCYWWEESRDFLNHIESNGGKLAVERPGDEQA
jgi:hypothetical protein